ncbi:polysaccharide pyruvyl transferase family protein [Cupriavidus consociatus]|uniref:polysaccharide pyruvyl transferase family protein n=1 Tax=Cupriavidus consociatus TaxID=2821357 RepID=UPI001AE6782A|nr:MULTISPECIES: polysaccharide pyruvyl transferase family protein [unclassified Cupriavidus]MBP0624942.1 polysaccharide pyruvyl transferase family protein [Cupriavidus sp. LEh25]MDK2661674.1 polysaccharide pyruvyl transferase family protein [Cupriavidus sp. LEh21]
MNSRCHVALLHAYSRKNSGDGLLVDLSVKMLREALGDKIRITVVAADPHSFSSYHDVVHAPVLAQNGFGRVAAALGVVLNIPIAPTRKLYRLLEEVDLIVGVGGGYLRARNNAEAAKLALGHFVQLRAARNSGKPAIYLPQSIGPTLLRPDGFASVFHSKLTRMLGGFERVYVRDERSLKALEKNSNTRRAPDLAVLEFSNSYGGQTHRVRKITRNIGHVALVLREAPRWDREQRKRYADSTRELISELKKRCKVTYAIQSSGRGNDDVAYYNRIGISDPLNSLKTILSEDKPDVVISVRLHGALESILAGVPAFHLSYERKGFGAYKDLGVDGWVENAADFSASRVIHKIFESNAIDNFWLSAEKNLIATRNSYDSIVSEIRRVTGNSQN